MVFDAGGPLIYNCRQTSILIVVHQKILSKKILSNLLSTSALIVFITYLFLKIAAATNLIFILVYVFFHYRFLHYAC